MTDVSKLKADELQELNKVTVEAEEVGLEDLIILGDDKKIPIHITFPNPDGTQSKAKALVKQLTLKELDGLNYNGNLALLSRKILEKALFKQDGTPFTTQEILKLPFGVVRAISEEILELSGVDTSDQKLPDF